MTEKAPYDVSKAAELFVDEMEIFYPKLGINKIEIIFFKLFTHMAVGIVSHLPTLRYWIATKTYGFLVMTVKSVVLL